MILLRLFKSFRKKKINQILDNIDKKDIAKRYFMLILGCFILAFAFNVFFDQYDLVCFGISGLSLDVNEFGIPTYLFIMVANVIN